MQETALEVFYINHSETIDAAIVVLFGSAMFISIFFNSTAHALLFAFLMFSGGGINAILSGGPARRASRAWAK